MVSDTLDQPVEILLTLYHTTSWACPCTVFVKYY